MDLRIAQITFTLTFICECISFRKDVRLKFVESSDGKEVVITVYFLQSSSS